MDSVFRFLKIAIAGSVLLVVSVVVAGVVLGLGPLVTAIATCVGIMVIAIALFKFLMTFPAPMSRRSEDWMATATLLALILIWIWVLGPEFPSPQ